MAWLATGGCRASGSTAGPGRRCRRSGGLNVGVSTDTSNLHLEGLSRRPRPGITRSARNWRLGNDRRLPGQPATPVTRRGRRRAGSARRYLVTCPGVRGAGSGGHHVAPRPGPGEAARRAGHRGQQQRRGYPPPPVRPGAACVAANIPDFSWFLLISGQDYPVRPMKLIEEDLPYLLFGLGRERLCGRVRAQHVGQGEHVPGGLQQRGGVVSHALRGDELVHGLVQVGGCQVIARRGRCTPGRLPRGRRGDESP